MSQTPRISSPFTCKGCPRTGVKELPGLYRIETIRTVKGESETTAEIRYFLSSREAKDEVLEDASRQYWSIENSLHWVLDVTSDEDQSRVRDEAAASNWAVLRKMALNLLKSDSEADTSIKDRRKQAGWDNDYREDFFTVTLYVSPAGACRRSILWHTNCGPLEQK